MAMDTDRVYELGLSRVGAEATVEADFYNAALELGAPEHEAKKLDMLLTNRVLRKLGAA